MTRAHRFKEAVPAAAVPWIPHVSMWVLAKPQTCVVANAMTPCDRNVGHTLTLVRLIAASLKAIRRPGQAFQRLDPQTRVPYLQLIPLMMVWSVGFAVLHFLFIDRSWLWRWPTVFWSGVLDTFLIGMPGGWLLAAIGLKGMAWMFRKPITIYQCEVAAFYLWMIWAVMPFIDSVHLLGVPMRILSLPSVPGAQIIAHASWLFAYPLILLQLGYIGRDLFRFGGWAWFKSGLLAIGALLIVRLILEPLPNTIERYYHARGIALELWSVSAMLVGWATLGLACIRLLIEPVRLWRWTGLGLTGATLWLIHAALR